jgi:hypothetical protein
LLEGGGNGATFLRFYFFGWALFGFCFVLGDRGASFNKKTSHYFFFKTTEEKKI